MLDFKAKIHPIQFRLDPAGEAYSAPPYLLVGFKVDYMYL